MCSQASPSELQHHERFMGTEREHGKGAEGGEGELICLGLDIERLDFKGCVKSPQAPCTVSAEEKELQGDTRLLSGQEMPVSLLPV